MEGNSLVGIVTGRDVRFERRMDALVKDVMTPKEQLVTAREDADFDEITSLLHEHRIEKVLLVNDRFELRGMVTVRTSTRPRRIPFPARTGMVSSGSAPVSAPARTRMTGSPRW